VGFLTLQIAAATMAENRNSSREEFQQVENITAEFKTSYGECMGMH